MVASSELITYQAIKAELIIREAFELIGISGSQVVAEQLEGSVRSLNILMADLANRNINLWTSQTLLLPLTSPTIKYNLPSSLIKVIQVDLKTSTRELYGTPSSSDGIAANAFDGNVNTACTQTTYNGTIGFQFNSPVNIKLLGIQSTVNQDYSLVIEYSNTGIDGDWLTFFVNPPTRYDTIITYPAGKLIWVNTNFVNGSYTYVRIREVSNAALMISLDITELYFNDQVVDTKITEVTPYAYLEMPIKTSTARPTIYAIDYQVVPVIYIWQAPTPRYNCLVIYYQRMIQTLLSYTESIDIPNSFYQAIVFGLAKILAIKYSPERLEYISPEFDDALQRAITKNTNTLPLKLRLHVR